MPKKLTQEEFIVEAVAVHGVGRYDYSQTVYNGGRNKVEIGCFIHGKFEQLPGNHTIQRHGCPRCGKKSMASTQRLGAEKFIKKALAVHGIGRYEYSQVVYRGNKTKVKIICPQHGIFEQTPNNHLTGKAGQGQNCPACGRQATIDGLRFNTADFVIQAQSVHGMLYDYSRVDYRRTGTKVEIGCPKHGVFVQTPQMHKEGNGCPTCAKEKWAENGKLSWVDRAAGRKAILYFLRIFDQQEIFYKVGITYLSVKERYGTKRSLADYGYEVLAIHSSANPEAIYDWEQSILDTFSHLSYRPKREFGGDTECFASADEILQIFPL